MCPQVGIFRTELLHLSERFILAQASELLTFRALMVGLRRTHGSSALSLPQNLRGIFMEDRTRYAQTWGRLLRWSGVIHPGWLTALRREHFSLLHAHFGPDALSAVPLAKAIRVPLIATFHGYDATLKEPEAGGLYLRAYLRRRHQLFKELTLSIAVSNFVAKKLGDLGCPAHKIAVNYIGVNRAVFHNRSARSQPLLLFVGRLVEQKGCRVLIEAFRRVTLEIPSLKLAIIGSGPEELALQQTAKDARLNVTFLGALPHEEVAIWMRRSSLLVVPSLKMDSGREEGFGLVAAEAQACGLPVVASNTGGLIEAIEHGKTGLHFQAGHVLELATILAKLMSSEATLSRMSWHAATRARRLFDIRTNARLLEELYSSCLGP